MLTQDEVNQTRKFEWKIKKAVVVKIVECGGSIFGGAVRDMYRHDIHAERYYELHKIYGNYSEEYIKYQDPLYLPYTLGRLDVPVDIDACIPESQFKKLLEEFKKMNLELLKKWDRDPSGYLRGCTIINGQVKHYRYTVNLLSNKSIISALKNQVIITMQSMPAFRDLLKTFQTSLEEFPIKEFELDLMVIKDIDIATYKVDAPFGNLDFECNGLIMDKHGIRLSEHVKPDIVNPIKRQNELKRVLKDILNKKAIMCERVTVLRSNKMFGKGWFIQSKNIRLINTCYLTEQAEASSDDGSSSTGGYCIICHEECDNPHYKLSCCDARYHGKCIIDCWNNSTTYSIRSTVKCPMCRCSLFGSEYVRNGLHTDNVYIETLMLKYNRQRRHPYNPPVNSLVNQTDSDGSDSESDSDDDLQNAVFTPIEIEVD